MSVDDGRERLAASNWRPRRTSTVVTAALGVAVTLGLAVAVDTVEPVLLALCSGLGLGGTVWASAVTERRIATILAGLLAPISGLALLGAVVAAAVVQLGWPPTPPVESFGIAPFVLAMAGFLSGFGAVTSLWGVTPTGDAGRTVARLVVAAFVPAVALLVAYLDVPTEPLFRAAEMGLDLALARGPANEPIGADGIAIPRLGGLFAVVAVSALAVRAALSRLPIAELAAEDSQETAEGILEWSHRWLGRLFALSGLLAGAGVVLPSAFPQLFAEIPPAALAVAVDLTLSTPIRWALLAVAVASTPAIVLPRLVRAVASDRFRPDPMAVLPLAVGGLLVLAVVATHGTARRTAIEAATSPGGRRFLEALFAEFGSLALILGVVVVGFAVAMLLFIVVLFAGLFRFLGSTMGVQTVSGGILAAAIGAAIAEASTIVVVAGVAASLLAWDVGEFADTLGREIGRAGDALGGELVHVVGATVLAIGSIGVGVGTMRAIDLVPEASAPAALLGAVVAAFGTLFLLLVLR